MQRQSRLGGALGALPAARQPRRGGRWSAAPARAQLLAALFLVALRSLCALPHPASRAAAFVKSSGLRGGAAARRLVALPMRASRGGVGLSEPQRKALLGLGYKEEEVDTMRVDVAESVLELETKRPWGDKPMPATWVDEARAARVAEDAKAEGAAKAAVSEPAAAGEPEQVGPFGMNVQKVKGKDGDDEVEVKVSISNGQIIGGLISAVVIGYFISSFTKPAGDALPEFSFRSSQQTAAMK